MRKTTISQRHLFDHILDEMVTQVGIEEELIRMDNVLDKSPKILQLIAAELEPCTQGREGIAADRVLRAAIVKQLKGYSYRELAERINDGVSLRWFTHFGLEPIPHFTALQKLIKAIGAPVWQLINDLLVGYAREKKIETGKALRVDTTVTQSNIAYPSDARLLNDSIRVLTGLMQEARELGVVFPFADRTRTAKKSAYRIAMAKGPKTTTIRDKQYRRLIKTANEVFRMACACLRALEGHSDSGHEQFYSQFESMVQLAATAIIQCERRILKGEEVPAEDKIVSIFEDHTDIIVRGKSNCPVEFGHKILLAAGKSGLITQYATLRGNPCDGEFLPRLIETHKTQFDRVPASLAADRRFFSADNEAYARKARVRRLSIVKPGKRSTLREAFEKQPWFRRLQNFRAGIEGLISALMRGCGLKRCLWKGLRSFESYVGLGIVTFNLRRIAQLT